MFDIESMIKEDVTDKLERSMIPHLVCENNSYEDSLDLKKYVRLGNPEKIKEILNRNAENFSSSDLLTAANLACEYNHFHIVKMILACDINARIKEENERAAYAALYEQAHTKGPSRFS